MRIVFVYAGRGIESAVRRPRAPDMLGRAARERVEREFTAERMVAHTIEVYDQVVSRSDCTLIPA